MVAHIFCLEPHIKLKKLNSRNFSRSLELKLQDTLVTSFLLDLLRVLYEMKTDKEYRIQIFRAIS